VGQAPVSAQVGEQDLGAPRVAVIAVTGSVVGHPEGRARLAVFREHRRDVRVMMLHRDDA
jgi:hypothetical protein